MSRSQARKPLPGGAVPLSQASRPAAARSASPGGCPVAGGACVSSLLHSDVLCGSVRLHWYSSVRPPLPCPAWPWPAGSAQCMAWPERGPWPDLAFPPEASVCPSVGAASLPWCGGTRWRTAVSSSRVSRMATMPRQPGLRLVSLWGLLGGRGGAPVTLLRPLSSWAGRGRVRGHWGVVWC